MRGLVVPEVTEDFAADQVELYFDLSYVFAFSQLVGLLLEHHDPPGLARAALLFLLLWLPWTQFTWSANAVSSSARVVRVLFLVATVASVPMAASVRTALGNGGPVFAIGLSVILCMALFALISGVETGSAVWRSAVGYAVPNLIAIVAVIVGAFLDETPRIILWSAGLAVVLVGTIRAGGKEWIVRAGHFAERHGLIVIIALGEVIVALGVPVVRDLQDGAGVPGRTVVALVASGTFAGLLWWSYFDRPGPAFEHRTEQLPSRERGRFVRDIYTYGHVPIVAGVILSAAALEEITLHPTDPLDAPIRWMLLAGLALYLGGVGLAVFRAFRAVATERIATIVLFAALVALGGSVPALVLLVIVDVFLLGMLIVEQLRIER